MTETEDRSTMYRDSEGEFRWRRVAANGEEVGASSEGYLDASDCRANYWRINGDTAPNLEEQ